MKIVLRAVAFLLLICLVPTGAHAKHRHLEKWYQDKWCMQHNGQTEVVLVDGTRADCLTHTHAIEFDFGKKWVEAVGQALYYGLQTGKRPGVVLIIESEKDLKYWLRLNSTVEHFGLPMDTWKVVD